MTEILVGVIALAIGAAIVFFALRGKLTELQGKLGQAETKSGEQEKQIAELKAKSQQQPDIQALVKSEVDKVSASLQSQHDARRRQLEEEYRRKLASLQQSNVATAQLAEVEKKEAEITRRETQIHQKESNVTQRESALNQRETVFLQKEKEMQAATSEISAKEKRMKDITADLESAKANLEKKMVEYDSALKKAYEILGLPPEELKKTLMQKAQDEIEKDVANLIKKRLESVRENVDRESRKILSLAIHKFAAPHTADTVVTVIDLDNDEMKGRIIGREGRNIRAFERISGVDVVIDDTPGAISLSCFDGVRREIAARAMRRLIADGRIHPVRIEEVIEQAKREMEDELAKTGKEFLQEQEIFDVNPKLFVLVGRLKYRTSYGQNVLQHIKEVGAICQTLAAELGLNAKLARRCGIFHDIGKAVDYTFEGSHPQLGGELLTRYGESQEVIEAALHHHSDPNQVKFAYTVLAAAADAVSASRPGARGETVETYFKRIERLEALAKSFDGVQQAFACQAGREVRIMVDAESVSDDKAMLMARDIAKSVEDQLTYPGEIRVTVIREKKITEYAR